MVHQGATGRSARHCSSSTRALHRSRARAAPVLPTLIRRLAPALRLLDAGTLGLLLTNNSVKALYALHRLRVAASRMGVVVIVEVAGLLLLVPSYGGAGAAGAYCIASWTGAALVFVKYLRIEHALIASSVTVRRYATALVPCCAVMGVTRFTGDVTSGALLVLALLVYAVAVRHLDLLTDADLAPLKGLLPQGTAGRHRASTRDQARVPASLGSLGLSRIGRST